MYLIWRVLPFNDIFREKQLLEKLNSGCADIEKNVEHFGFEILQFYLASVAHNLIKHP